MIEILSLGGGVQSSTVLRMSILGELPKLDHAIFADTMWEPKAVYDHVEKLRAECEAAGIAFHRVSAGNIRDDAVVSMVRGVKSEGQRWAAMPLFTLNPDGSQGLIKRQCTKEYKIEPIEKCIKQTILGLKPRQRAPKEQVVRQWFGISFDERQRMRLCEDKWRSFWYPLVEDRHSRNWCHDWLTSRGFGEAPRSACIGCPFHTNDEWRKLRDESPAEFADAVEVDKAIRKCGGMRGDVFLHRQMVPLDEIDLRTDLERGQLPLFDMRDECSGMCGV